LVESIGSQALAFCSELVSVKILSKAPKMSSGIFDADPGLETAGPLDGLNSLGQPYNIQFIWGTIADSTEVPENAFSYGLRQSASDGLRSYLQSVDLPYGITKIGQSAFKNTASLTSINLPNSLKEIASQAFWKTNLSDLTIPESVDYMAKQMCHSALLKHVYIKTAHINRAKDGMTVPEDALFYNCVYGLTIYIPIDPYEAATTYGDYWDVKLLISDTYTTHEVVQLSPEELVI
jgi:hypothetical protein